MCVLLNLFIWSESALSIKYKCIHVENLICLLHYFSCNIQRLYKCQSLPFCIVSLLFGVSYLLWNVTLDIYSLGNAVLSKSHEQKHYKQDTIKPYFHSSLMRFGCFQFFLQLHPLLMNRLSLCRLHEQQPRHHISQKLFTVREGKIQMSILKLIVRNISNT